MVEAGVTPEENMSRLPFTPSDEQTMWRVQQHGDAAAFGELVHRWQEPIQRLCTRMTGDLHRGEDLAQEAFLRVFTRRQDYRPQGKFSTWLWQIALNLCRDDARYQRRHPVTSLETAGSETEEAFAPEAEVNPVSPATDVARLEQAEIIRKALRQLDEPHRMVVILRHYEGLKFAEIAEILGIPEGTVKSRLAEALNRLAPHLHILRNV